jgi:hypothetical protein
VSGSEDTVEQATIEWFEDFGYAIAGSMDRPGIHPCGWLTQKFCRQSLLRRPQPPHREHFVSRERLDA